MRVRLLGPVDVLVDGVSRPVPGLRRRAVLAVLGLHHSAVVSADRLLDAVWSDDAGSATLNALQSHVSDLRGLLGKTAIRASAPGYVLDLGADGSDVQAAERLIEEAGRADGPGERAALLRSALALWRGRPLADVAGLPRLGDAAERLHRLWLAATRSLIEARLASGEHALVLPDLERLVEEHRYDEQLHGQLMLALYRGGRQTDALAAYRRLRNVLTDELGVDPGPSLRDLEAAILRQDPALEAPAGAPVSVPAPMVRPAGAVPAQLPMTVAAFTGRSGELASLDALLRGPTVQAVVIAAISGTPGVGKTALAVHWAHRVADRFPDGQLYVNLRGFDPDGAAMTPADAVRGFLIAAKERGPVIEGGRDVCRRNPKSAQEPADRGGRTVAISCPDRSGRDGLEPVVRFTWRGPDGPVVVQQIVVRTVSSGLGTGTRPVASTGRDRSS